MFIKAFFESNEILEDTYAVGDEIVLANGARGRIVDIEHLEDPDTTLYYVRDYGSRTITRYIAE